MEGNISFNIILKMSVGNFNFYFNEPILHIYILKILKTWIYKFLIPYFLSSHLKLVFLDCMLLSCHVRVNLQSIVALVSRNSLLETGTISEV